MGKHSASNSAKRGSLADLWRSSATSHGRHSDESAPVGASSILRRSRQRPVVAAIAVPTVAVLAVAAAGFIGAPNDNEPVATVEQVGATEEPSPSPAQTDAADAPIVAEAKKESEKKSQTTSANLKTPEPKAEQKSAASTSDKSTTKKKSSSSKSSGSTNDKSEDNYSGPMTTAQIKEMLGGPGSGWYNLVKCESNFNPRATNGTHFGLFQFSPSTWRSVGGKGNPADASPQEQFKRAKMLKKKAGAGQWSCSF